MLLDEPLANLDRHLRQEMEDTFRDFQRRSGAVMVDFTPDQSEAMALATDIGVMFAGTLPQVYPPRRPSRRQADRTRRAFSRQAPKIGGQLRINIASA